MHTQPWFLELRAILELFYFVAAVVLVGGVFFAKHHLKAALSQLAVAADQLDLARKDVKLRYQREAVVAALQQCDEFRKFLADWMATGPAIYDPLPPLEKRVWEMRDLSFDLNSIEDKPALVQWLTLLVKNTARLNRAIDACNRLETFASHFMKKAADEETAFGSTGDVFCEMAARLAPLIIALRQGGIVESTGRPISSGAFEGVVGLYSIWYQRARQQRLERDARAAAAKAAKFQIPVLRPLGVDE